MSPNASASPRASEVCVLLLTAIGVCNRVNLTSQIKSGLEVLQTFDSVAGHHSDYTGDRRRRDDVVEIGFGNHAKLFSGA